jgi:hypothetical protein
MTREALERRAAELAAQWPLPAKDWPPIIAQAERVLEIVSALDELPLAGVEPGTIYEAAPGHD